MSATEHIQRAKTERPYYKLVCQESHKMFKNAYPDNSVPVFGTPLQPCSNDITLHISFDYAQQIHYPADPLQPGPIYFLTPRKCGIFGVCSETLQKQVKIIALTL